MLQLVLKDTAADAKVFKESFETSVSQFQTSLLGMALTDTGV